MQRDECEKSLPGWPASTDFGRFLSFFRPTLDEPASDEPALDVLTLDGRSLDGPALDGPASDGAVDRPASDGSGILSRSEYL